MLSIGLMLACIAISIAIRSIGATTNPQCPGIDHKALAIHEGIIAGSKYVGQSLNTELIRPKKRNFEFNLWLLKETLGKLEVLMS